MNEQVRGAVTAWMNSVGIRNSAELDVNDWQQVKQLLGNDRPGFGIFLSLVMFERQTAAAQLVNADLSSSSGAVAAAKLQGMIQCVDNIRSLIVDIADPSGEGSGSVDDREVAGVRFNEQRSTERNPVS